MTMLEQEAPPTAPPPIPSRPADPMRVMPAVVVLVMAGVLVAGLALGLSIGRASSRADASPPAPGEWDAWLPDCAAVPSGQRPACDVEVVVRRFMGAWQAGEPVGELATPTFRAPERAPRGPLSRAPRVVVAPGGLNASVTAFTESDGQFVMRLVQREAGWRVEAVQP